MLTNISSSASAAFKTSLCAVSILFVAAFATACDSSSESDGAAADKADETSKKDDAKDQDKDEGGADEGGSGEPKEGGSCKGISATDGLIACEGNKVIFCSSYSQYKWTKQTVCEDGTKCVAEGKSASCK